MDYYTLVILASLIGFLLLAALLLVPVYRFLQREDEAAQRFTDVYLRKQQELHTDGTTDATEQKSPNQT
jgi:type II secretory pathway pseudopilin PulG